MKLKLNRHTMRCFNEHMGHWMMLETRMKQLHDFIMAENITFEPEEALAADDKRSADQVQKDQDNSITTLTAEGVLIVPIEGAMMRAQSSMGGASTVQIRRILRDASTNSAVSAVMLSIDSPGGTVAGTEALAEEVKAFGEIKPIHAHVGSLMASAAYWAGSQVSHISAARTAEVGSLGTVAVVHDMSEAAKNEGIKVHVISTGPHKGAFTPGSEVTQEQLDDLQDVVNDLNAIFMESVQGARSLSDKDVKTLFDGRVHVAGKALDLGLIDGISSFEEAIANLTAMVHDVDLEAAELRLRSRL